MRIPFAKPIVTLEEAEEVKSFLVNCNGRLTDGEMTRNFERDFANYIGKDPDKNVYCLATNSCMSALMLSYMALGVGKGDKVIVPAMSHVATAHAVEMVGAEPVFVDCYEEGSISIDNVGDILKKDIFSDIKAISVMHYTGAAVYAMGYFKKLSEDYAIPIVEDCALAVGTICKDKRNSGTDLDADLHVGLIGDCGCFSFYPSKQLAIGEGGMFVTTDKELYDRAKCIRAFGKTEGDNAIYDIGLLGANFRMTEMQAVLGLQRMKKLDAELKVRNINLDILKFNFPGKFIGGSYCAIMQCDRFGKSRDWFRTMLKSKGVETSIYYPHPIPRLKYYRDKYGYAPGKFINAEYIADKTLALPIGGHVDMGYMIEVLKEMIV